MRHSGDGILTARSRPWTRSRSERPRRCWWKNAGSATWRKMVKSGFSDAIGSCRITAICRPRIRRSSRWLLRVRSSPSKSTRPPTMRPARGKSPTIERHVVVLPLPDSPTSPRVSPSRRVKLTPSTALTTRAPPKVKKCVWRPATCKTASRLATALGEALQIPQLGIEPNAQPVAEQLGREHDQQDARPRKDREPPLAGHQGGARLREHEPTGRLRRRDAHAEEAQRGLGD